MRPTEHAHLESEGRLEDSWLVLRYDEGLWVSWEDGVMSEDRDELLATSLARAA